MKEEQEQIAFKFYQVFPVDGTYWDASSPNYVLLLYLKARDIIITFSFI